MRASYRHAVQWIALNDDTTDLRAEDPVATVTVCLVADLFGKSEEAVIADVVRYLEKQEKKEWLDDEN